MERIGRLGDGGKWTCGMSRYSAPSKESQKCIVYSFGVEDDSSFENEFLSRVETAEVWAYDFSVSDFGIQLEPDNRNRAHFTQAGIAGKTTSTDAQPSFYSIADLMKQNGHEYIDILKMDIEGSEFEALDGLSEAFPASQGLELPIGQLLIEVHMKTHDTAQWYLEWWDRLAARGLRPVWTEPNVLGIAYNMVNGDPTIALEYTFLNVQDRRSRIFKGTTLDVVLS